MKSIILYQDKKVRTIARIYADGKVTLADQLKDPESIRGWWEGSSTTFPFEWIKKIYEEGRVNEHSN